MKKEITQSIYAEYQNIRDLPFEIQKTYIQNHHIELKSLMCPRGYTEVLDELTTIKRQLSRPITPIQRYAKTKHAATYLDVDPSFLDKKRKDGLFEEGIHYFRPEGCNLILWDIEALGKWVTTIGGGNDSITIIDNMFN